MDKYLSSEMIHEIVNEYSDMIVRIAFHYTFSRADAEDIMQEVFLALLNQPVFENGNHLKAWLIRVSINKSKNYIKALKRRKACALMNFENIEAFNENFVIDELKKLNEKDRTIIYLFYYEGYKAKEISKLLGKTEKAILMSLSRARNRLKNILEENNEI